MIVARDPSAGVTLIEMMIALALFALIGSAGFAMLDQVLRSQQHTEGRLERLSEMQRAMHVLAADFAMAESRSLTVTDPGVVFHRSHSGGSLRLRYQLNNGILHRHIARPDGTPWADQAILSGLESMSWRYLTPDGIWSDIWPVDAALATPPNPKAIEVVIVLAGNAGSLRRVAPLPAELD